MTIITKPISLTKGKDNLATLISDPADIPTGYKLLGS